LNFLDYTLLFFFHTFFFLFSFLNEPVVDFSTNPSAGVMYSFCVLIFFSPFYRTRVLYLLQISIVFLDDLFLRPLGISALRYAPPPRVQLARLFMRPLDFFWKMLFFVPLRCLQDLRLIFISKTTFLFPYRFFFAFKTDAVDPTSIESLNMTPSLLLWTEPPCLFRVTPHPNLKSFYYLDTCFV